MLRPPGGRRRGLRWLGNALAYHGTVSLSPIAVERRLTIVFSDRPSWGNPVVMADGPTTSRHGSDGHGRRRCASGTPGDHEQTRWTLLDGLQMLDHRLGLRSS